MSRLARRVQRAIGRLSADVKGTATFRRTIPGAYDLGADSRTGDTEVTVAVAVVVLPADPRTFGDSLLATDRRTLVVAAADLEYSPEPGDRFDLGTWRWTVSGVRAVQPNGVDALLYRLDVQGSPAPNWFMLDGAELLDGSHYLTGELALAGA